VATAAQPALAGGYYTGVRGARASGRAGAFTARADDLSAVALNPAGLARVDGTLLQVGNRFSYNAYEFTRAPTLDWGNLDNRVPPYVEFAPTRSQTPWQLLDPTLGVASNLGLRDWGFALAFYPPAGTQGVEFPIDGGQRYMMVKREALIVNYAASAAYRVDQRFAVGASLQWIAVPKLEYELVFDGNPFGGDANPVSSELDMLAHVEGSDLFTLNATLGAWYRPAPFLELGVSGQVIPSEIRTNSTLKVTPLSPDFGDEVELTRDSVPANDVSLTLPLPLTARVGIRYLYPQGPNELFDVELDVAYETWSNVERFTVQTDGLVANLEGENIDVGVITLEKHWRDTVSVHLGGDYNAIPEQLTVRGGLFYESAVATRSYAHLDFPSGRQMGATLGGSVFVQGVEVALAYEYRHQPTLKVTEGDARVYQEVPGSPCEPPYTDPDMCHPQYLGRPAPPVNAGTYRAHAHVGTVDVLYRF
jgi:long-subunit fatty acid transport protein